MRQRKRGCSLSLAFIFLFVWIFGHATADSDDDKEEEVPGAVLPPLKLGHSVCALKADEGPCKAIHMRYYFNLQSRECEIFEYGGCYGNENNFLTLEECQETCVVTEFPVKRTLGKFKKEKPNFCFHEKDPGICRGYFSRYFYNKETKICEKFKYGGCLGNQNNFKSLEECQATCQSSSNLLPIAPTEDHPNTVNRSSPEEEEPNQFPGFFGHRSRNIPSFCMTPMDRGLCRARERRFFYSYATGKCQPFHYSGCGGNENNFTSRKSCLSICKKGFIKKRSERRLIRIKKKRKKQSVKVVGDEITAERI
ncbi:tissue factor pathway inhibitor [Eudromia elegans]